MLHTHTHTHDPLYSLLLPAVPAALLTRRYELLAACVTCDDFEPPATAPEDQKQWILEVKNRTTRVFFMALTSSEEDVVNVAKTGLEHFLQQNKIPRDVLQVRWCLFGE